MVDNKKHLDAEQLYRRYQETRDNIPFSILHTINSSAESAMHEESIHTIVELVKVAENTQQYAATPAEKISWWSSIHAKLSFISDLKTAKPLVFGVACLAMLVITGPLLLNPNQQQTFPELAHLGDCQQCDGYINNALATTRSNLPGFSQSSPDDKIANKLGNIRARLRVESIYDPKIAKINASEQLQKLGLASDAQLKTASDLALLNQLIIDASPNTLISTASEALFIANISVRDAIDRPDTALDLDSIEQAINSLALLAKPSELQKNALQRLKKEAAAKPLSLSKLLKQIELAKRSLG